MGGRAPLHARAVEHDGELVARVAVSPGQEAQQRRPSRLETLSLVGAQVGIAADHVVAVDEPAHQRLSPSFARLTTWPNRR